MKKLFLVTFLGLVMGLPAYAANVQNDKTPSASLNCYPNEQFLLYDRIATDFSLYTNYRAGLIRQARYESQVKPEDRTEFLLYKNEYVKARNLYRGQLQGRLTEAKYFFNKDTQKLIDQFIAWDNAHIGDSIADKSLPTTAQYNEWENKIISSMAQQLKK